MSEIQGTPSKYNKVAMILHWLIALMIIGQLIGGFYMHNLEFSDLKISLYQWHKSFGLMVLFLSIVRLGWRFTHKVPALPSGMKSWEKLAARGTHIGFYILMIAVPFLGWLMVSADPNTVRFPTKLFYLIPIPNLPVAVDQGLADQFAELHEFAAKLIIGLLALHIGAALKHQFVEKDDVLARMLPGRILSK